MAIAPLVAVELGNTMMRLPAMFDGAGAAKAKRDLDRLLRASLSWDPPGR